MFVLVIASGTNEKCILLDAGGLCAHCLNRSVVALGDKEILFSAFYFPTFCTSEQLSLIFADFLVIFILYLPYFPADRLPVLFAYNFMAFMVVGGADL